MGVPVRKSETPRRRLPHRGNGTIGSLSLLDIIDTPMSVPSGGIA
jgi:hypothetical protein